MHCGIIVAMGAASPEHFTWGKVLHRMEREGRNNRQNSRQSTALVAGPSHSVSWGQHHHCSDSRQTMGPHSESN